MNTTKRTLELLTSFVLAESDEKRKEIVHELSAIKDKQDSVVDDSVRMIVEDIISDMGIPCHIIGHGYIVTAVCAIVENENLQGITKVLYPHVARVHNTTASRVERAIRHAIECSWDRCDVDVLHSYFGNTVSYSKGKPTNGEFLWCVAKEVRRIEGGVTKRKGA